MHDRAADPERHGGVPQRLVRHRLELRVGNRVGLPAEPLPLRLRPGEAGLHALDDPAPLECRDGAKMCFCSFPAGVVASMPSPSDTKRHAERLQILEGA